MLTSTSWRSSSRALASRAGSTGIGTSIATGSCRPPRQGALVTPPALHMVGDRDVVYHFPGGKEAATNLKTLVPHLTPDHRAAGLRPLDPAGAAGRGQRRTAGVRAVSIAAAAAQCLEQARGHGAHDVVFTEARRRGGRSDRLRPLPDH